MMGKSAAENLDMSSRLGVIKTPSKMAAIRGIMKERQGKRIQQKNQSTVSSLMSPAAQHDMPTENQADTGCPSNTLGFSTSITKAVTFDEDAPLFDRQNSEHFDDSMFHSPSLWAMVGDGEQEWSARELLHGSIMSITPGAKTLACAVADRTDEPNVSWRDNEMSNPLEDSVPAQLFPPEMTSRDEDNTSDLSMNNSEDAKPCYHGDQKENISIHSLPPSEMTSTPLRGFLDTSFPPVLLPSSPFTTFKQNSTSVELHETNFYVDKIEELEQKLAVAEKRAASEEAKRVEAEQFVLAFSRKTNEYATTSVQPKSATKTLSNKFVEMSPMTPGCDSVTSVLSESLWERNMTLVKEVRFADQTCVELSGQKLALENQMIVLESNMATISRENEELKNQVAKANEAYASTEAKSASLQQSGHVQVRLGTHRENEATEVPSGEGSPSQRDNTGPNVLKSSPSADGHREDVNTSQEDLLWMNDVLEKNLKESQITVESLSSELETVHAQNEALMSQLRLQRAQAKSSIERIVQAMHIQGLTFSNELVNRLDTLESRLEQLRQTVLWMENELVFESEDENQSRSSSLESTGESLSEPATAENASDSLIQMEEARSGTRTMANGMVIQLSPASSTLSPFSQRTDSNLSMSNLQGISELSESSSVMEQRDDDDQLLQHLLWLSSPDAVQAPMTPGLADAFKENDSNCRSKSAKKPTVEQHSRHYISPRRLVEASARENWDTGDHTTLPSAGGLYARLEFLQRQTDSTEQKLAAKGIFPKATQSPQLSVLASRVVTDQLSKQLSTLCQQKEEDDRKLQNLASALQDATANVVRLSKECESLNEEGDRMLVENKELKAINIDLQNELNGYRLRQLSEEIAAEELERLRRLLESTEVLCQKFEIELKEAKEDKKKGESIKSKEINSLNELLQRTQERTCECEAVLQQALADKTSIQTTTNKEIQSWKSAHQLISEQLVERDASLKQALLDKSELDHGKMNAENKSQTLKTKLEECRAELREARSDNEKIESMRTSLEKSLATVESCLKEREKEFSSSIEKQEYAISDLQQKNGVLSLKCERLRACVRKLTAKCDEWEGFLERHSQFVHQLENKYENSRQQARQLAAMYSTEKAKALSLQHELDLAARELQKIGS